MEQLVKECQMYGLLKYTDVSKLKEIFAGNIKGHTCPECGYALCLWEQNQEKVRLDNNILKPTATNKQKRFCCYKQFAYIIHGHLSKGDRQQLPKCVLDGIRESWPEDSEDKYTGFKEK